MCLTNFLKFNASITAIINACITAILSCENQYLAHIFDKHSNISVIIVIVGVDAEGGIGGDVDASIKPPEVTGSLNPKGKGGFKFPSFNRKDKKPKIGKFFSRNYVIIVFSMA